MNPEVSATFKQYPSAVRSQLKRLRTLILKTAASLEEVGELEETLKWSEPAYLTSQTGSGTTIRLNWKPATPDQFRMLVHCQTTVIDTCRSLFPELSFDGNRAIVFNVQDEIPEKAIRTCVEIALTYHSAKRRQ